MSGFYADCYCSYLFSIIENGGKEMIIISFLLGILLIILLDFAFGFMKCKKYHDMTRDRYDA